MSEEVPPSSLTVSPKRGGPGHARPAAGSDSAYMLRVTPRRWIVVPPTGSPLWLVKPAMVVIGSWLLLAWNRVGFQGISAPRAIVRFALVGIYGWIALALLLWLGGKLLGRLDRGRPRDDAGLERLLQLTGLAHQPLLIMGFAIQITQAIPIPLFGTAIASLALLLWMPAMLIALLATTLRSAVTERATVVVVSYGAWLATVGRYLYQQLGHLI